MLPIPLIVLIAVPVVKGVNDYLNQRKELEKKVQPPKTSQKKRVHKG